MRIDNVIIEESFRSGYTALMIHALVLIAQCIFFHFYSPHEIPSAFWSARRHRDLARGACSKLLASGERA